jgi:hypothetical protein
MRAGKLDPVIIYIRFGALDERYVRLHNPTNVVALGEDLARSKYGGIA